MRQVQKHAFILAGVFLLWFAAHAAIKPTQGTGRVIEDFKEIPMQVGKWSGSLGKFDEQTQKSLPHCALFTADYEDDKGYDSNLSMVYGADLGDFHQPEYCMEGQGWRRLTSQEVTVKSEKPHKAVMLTMQNDYQHIVVLYWFASQNGTTTVLGGQKAVEFLDRLRNGKLKASAMVRFITPVQSEEASAKANTMDLASKIDPYITKMLAKPPVFEKGQSGELGE